jgi:hypothetical protein
MNGDDLSSDPIARAVIIGSTRQGCRGGIVSEWFCDHAKQRDDLIVDGIDLADTPL